MHGEIKSNKKHHCAHTHMICAEALIWGRKWESGELLCSKWSQGAWTFRVWAHAARLLWRVLWGESNIRYNETFTDRPSFQPPLSHVLLHRAYSDWSLSAGLPHARAVQDMRRKTLDSIMPFLGLFIFHEVDCAQSLLKIGFFFFHSTIQDCKTQHIVCFHPITANNKFNP